MEKPLAILGLLLCCSGIGCAESTDPRSAQAVASEQSKEPLTTADAAAGRIGQTALVEFTVVAVKHPKRRKAVFLTSSANFRSPASLAVVIQDSDLANFGAKDDQELAERYVGRRVRASGQIARDEGQVVVRVSIAEQITIAEPTSEPSTLGELLVFQEDKAPKALSTNDFAQLPQQSLDVEHDGATQTYSGVTMDAVLRQAGVTLGEEARGKLLSRYVLVTSSDGYQVLFSIGEIDPKLQERPILLADKCDGKSFEASEGPWQLVVPGDLRQRRWVRSVARVEVRSPWAELKGPTK